MGQKESMGWAAGYTVEEIGRLARKYPWFDAAREAEATRTGGRLPAHILLAKASRLYNPVELIAAVEPETNVEAEALFANDGTLDIIDSFIEKGEHRIVADENTPDDIPGLTPDDVALDDEMLSEELAEIFLKQGLITQAQAIFERLSLLYPEKSVYFAELIRTAQTDGKVSTESV